MYEKRYPKAVSVFEAEIGDTLSYLSYPGPLHARGYARRERTGEALQGGEEADEGGWGVPERDERVPT